MDVVAAYWLAVLVGLELPVGPTMLMEEIGLCEISARGHRKGRESDVLLR